MPIPYGNAFLVETPNIDKFADRIYAEEADRKKQQQKETDDADKLMAKELSGIRSADASDFINKYNEYKGFKKQLYNQRIAKNPQEYDRLNREANLAMADAMRISQKSAEFKEQLKYLNSLRAKDPDRYSDDYANMYSTAMNTPVNQIENTKFGDLSNLDSWNNTGSSTDFSKIITNAMGGSKPFLLGESNIEDKDKFTSQKRQYFGYNDPLTQYNLLIRGLNTSKQRRDFPLKFGSSVTPQQEEDIEANFQALMNDPEYRKAYPNIKDDMQFPQEAYTTNIGRAARILAMQNALNATARPTFKTIEKNKSEDFFNAKTEEQRAQLNTRLKASVDRLYAAYGLKQEDANDPNKVADKIINDYVLATYASPDGLIEIGDGQFNLLSGSKKRYGTKVKALPNGDIEYGRYVTNDDGTTTYKTDAVIPYLEARARISKGFPKAKLGELPTKSMSIPKNTQKPIEVTDEALLKKIKEAEKNKK